MKDLFVAAAAIVAAVAGLAVYLVKGTDYYCPQPSAASIATLFDRVGREAGAYDPS